MEQKDLVSLPHLTVDRIFSYTFLVLWTRFARTTKYLTKYKMVKKV